MRRLSTSVSRLALLALFAAPVVLADAYLVPVYSGRAKEMEGLGFEVRAASRRRWLLLGDSTARRLHFWPPGAVLPRDRDDDGWLNFGLGGSTTVDWTLLCEKARRIQPRLERTAIVASVSNYGGPGPLTETPYIAYLTGWRDAIRFYRSGELGAREAARLAVKQAFHIYSDRNDVMFSFLRPDPDLSVWADRLNFRAPPRGSAFEGDTPESAAARRAVWMERLAECAARGGHRPLFVLSPLHTFLRNSPQHADRLRFYEAACALPGVRCLNLEAAFPDKAFVSDYVHLKGEFQGALLERVERAVRAE